MFQHILSSILKHVCLILPLDTAMCWGNVQSCAVMSGSTMYSVVDSQNPKPNLGTTFGAKHSEPNYFVLQFVFFILSTQTLASDLCQCPDHRGHLSSTGNNMSSNFERAARDNARLFPNLRVLDQHYDPLASLWMSNRTVPTMTPAAKGRDRVQWLERKNIVKPPWQYKDRFL